MSPAPFGFITVRVGSSRLNSKCLLEFGDCTVLQHVIRRAKAFGFRPVVCTTDKTADDIVQTTAKTENVLCFRGSEQDKLKRWLDACHANGVETFHTIDADDPFFDGNLGHKSIQLLQQGGYDVVAPSENTFFGSVGYSLTASIIQRACALKTSDDTEMMWYYLEKVPQLRKTELPVAGSHVKDVRLTLDYDEDYWLLRTVLRILGPLCSLDQINRLFSDNPDLTLVNWFRNEQWRSRQLEKKI